VPDKYLKNRRTISGTYLINNPKDLATGPIDLRTATREVLGDISTTHPMKNLIAAVLKNDVPGTRQLLQSEPDLATTSFRTEKLFRAEIFHWIYVGDTPLHLAAAGYRAEIVRLLLKHGADPNAARNRRKSTPLHYAADGFITCPAGAANPQVKTLECLLENGASLQAQDANGATALHRAVRTRSAAAVKFLLAAGSDMTMRNKPGSTPFHLAVQNTGRGGSGTRAAINAQREIIEAFLSAGADLNLTDSRGKSVNEWARSQWVREVLGT